MKTRKLTYKIVNFLTFLGYATIVLAFSSGVSDKNRDALGHIKKDPSLQQIFESYYSSAWEVAEIIYLIALFLIIISNLVTRKRFKKDMTTILFSVFSFVLPFSLFILKLIFINVDQIYLADDFKKAMGFIRMCILYNTFLLLIMEKRSLPKLIYRDNTSEIFLRERIKTFSVKQAQVVQPISDRNILAKEDNEFVMLNNFSSTRQAQSKQPQSYRSEVSNKLHLLLVEKVKIPKFIDSEANTVEEVDLHQSGESLLNHLTFKEEISVIYQNSNMTIPEKYSNIISELNRMPDITFNVFKLSQISEGNELFVVMYHLMHLYNFSETLQIKKLNYKNYFYLVNRKYRKNPYHNSIHGCDVTQTMFFLIKTCNIDSICNLTELDIFSCFFASSIHDLDHPGNNNNYEIAVGSTLAISYNDKAVLENYHLCKAFSLLRKEHCDVYEGFSRSNYNTSRAIIINMVLSTDMANHFSDLALTKNRVKAEDFNPAEKDKQLMLNQLIHAADISNPVKPFNIYKEWVSRVFIEFYDQGDKEREKGLKISYLCDRHTTNIIDAQIGFIDNITYPLFDSLCFAFPNMKMITNLISNNKEEFKSMKERGDKFTI